LKLKKLIFASVIGAAYAALTIALAPISYGPLQFRVAEALTILPFFFPISSWGLFAGCVLANLVSQYGVVDIVFGSLATLAAALMTMGLGKFGRENAAVKVHACLPPVVMNALVVGAVISYAQTGFGSVFWAAFTVNAAEVGIGELGVLYLIGLPLMIFLPKMAFFRKMIKEYDFVR